MGATQAAQRTFNFKNFNHTQNKVPKEWTPKIAKNQREYLCSNQRKNHRKAVLRLIQVQPITTLNTLEKKKSLRNSFLKF